jgi:K(+)-stimulated pyrophosphate-energized sodium pump
VGSGANSAIRWGIALTALAIVVVAVAISRSREIGIGVDDGKLAVSEPASV